MNLRGLISAGVSLVGFAALSSTLPVLAQTSPTQGGSMQNMPGGSMQGAPTQGGAMENSPMQSSPMQSSPMQSSPMQSSPTSLSSVDRQFIMKAAQSDMTEIKTSQLALSRSQNPQVRQFAQEMIQQHTQSSSKLKPLAAAKGVMLPKALGTENQALLTQLTKLSGAKFDQAYMNGQTKAHAKTQAAYQKELQQGKDPAVKAFASQILPIVTAHLRMAQNMVAGR